MEADPSQESGERKDGVFTIDLELIIVVNPLDNLGRILPDAKALAKINGAGLRSGWGCGAHPCALEFLGAPVICIQLRKRVGQVLGMGGMGITQTPWSRYGHCPQ